MSYKIFLTRRAEKDLDKMDSDDEELTVIAIGHRRNVYQEFP